MNPGSSSLSMSMMAIPSAADALDQAAIQVDRSLVADSSYMDMSDLLQVQKHSKYLFLIFKFACTS